MNAITWCDACKGWVPHPHLHHLFVDHGKKNPYSPPHLRVYGDIRTMTETSAMGTMTDHGHGKFRHKTT